MTSAGKGTWSKPLSPADQSALQCSAGCAADWKNGPCRETGSRHENRAGIARDLERMAVAAVRWPDPPAAIMEPAAFPCLKGRRLKSSGVTVIGLKLIISVLIAVGALHTARYALAPIAKDGLGAHNSKTQWKSRQRRARNWSQPSDWRWNLFASGPATWRSPSYRTGTPGRLLSWGTLRRRTRGVLRWFCQSRRDCGASSIWAPDRIGRRTIRVHAADRGARRNLKLARAMREANCGDMKAQRRPSGV